MKARLLIILLLFSSLSFAQNGLRFDGVDDYVQASNAGPQGNSPRTVEAWINMNAISTSQQVIVDWGDMPNGQRFTLNVINGKPRIEVGGSGFIVTNPLAAGSWHHLAAVYDAAQVKLYVDGVLTISGGFTVSVNTSNLNGIIIGRRIDGINYFDGIVDEVRIWNVARTATQVAANMNKEICSPFPGLVDYYDFNQGVAGGVNTTINTLNDLSGNSNNGNLMNFGLAGGVSNWVTGQTLTRNSASTISPTACQSYTSPAGNSYTSSGTYTDTIASSNGCDSIITIQLTLNTVDTSITQNNNVLTSNAVGAIYQWIDCNNGNQNIPGQTNATFTALFNGSYSVRVTQNGCTATSSCHIVNNVGLNESNLIPFSVYPNPLHNDLFIDLDQSIINNPILIKLTDITGHEVMRAEVQNAGKSKLDVSGYVSGIYLLELKTSQVTYRTKIVKY